MDSTTGRYTADFYPRVLANSLLSPNTKTRLMPYSISHPISIDHRIIIRLPEEWDVTESKKQIASEAFEYSSEISYDQHKEVTLHYTYKSLRDHIEAKDVKNHLKQIDAVTNDLSFQLAYGGVSTSKSEPNIPFVIISIIASIGIFMVLRKIYRYDPRAQNYQFAHDQISGLIILPAIGLCILPFRVVIQIFEGNYFDYVNWKILTDPGYISYSPAYGVLILIELLYNLALLGFSILLIIQLFQKRTSFPLLVCLFLGANLFFTLAEYSALHSINLPASYKIPNQTVEILSAILVASIWIPYFQKADQVKGTFRARLPEKY